MWAWDIYSEMRKRIYAELKRKCTLIYLSYIRPDNRPIIPRTTLTQMCTQYTYRNITRPHGVTIDKRSALTPRVGYLRPYMCIVDRPCGGKCTESFYLFRILWSINGDVARTFHIPFVLCLGNIVMRKSKRKYESYKYICCGKSLTGFNFVYIWEHPIVSILNRILYSKVLRVNVL